jgi:tripartite-type tricarboxylate transporter receptor subunit TctC
MAKVKTSRIPYKSSGLALTAILVGEVQFVFATAGPVGPHIKSGRLRPLAVTSLKASALSPGLPPVAATLPGYEATSVFSLFAPAKTPSAIITRLNEGLVRVLSSAEVKEKFLAAGIETVGSSPQELGAFMWSEMERMGKVIKDAGIRAE